MENILKLAIENPLFESFESFRSIWMTCIYINECFILLLEVSGGNILIMHLYK